MQVGSGFAVADVQPVCHPSDHVEAVCGGTIKRSSGRSANVPLRTNFLYRTRAPIGLVLMLTRFLGAEVHRSS